MGKDTKFRASGIAASQVLTALLVVFMTVLITLLPALCPTPFPPSPPRLFPLGDNPLAPDTAYAASETPKRNVLLLNSYHAGYRWSDDIIDGVRSVLLRPGNGNIDLHVEEMDTQRVTDPEYQDKLFEVYRQKFRQRPVDLVLCADDNAFTFMQKHVQALFPGVPVVFCGVNYLDDRCLTDCGLFTGVVEDYDLKATIETALRLRPQTKQIYWINDRSTTGRAIEKKMEETIPFFNDRIRFEALQDKTMPELLQTVQSLPDDSLVLFLIFNQDAAGRFFAYDESVSMIAEKSRVPLFGAWDFSLGHGIVGGMLTGGFSQGEAAAKLALRVLQGEKPSDIPVVREGVNRYMFDDTQLRRFGIDPVRLPAGSVIINQSYTDKKQILLLQSYDSGMDWTANMEAGIRAVFNDTDRYTLYLDYMDAKRNISPEYMHKTVPLFIEKYKNKHFDAVIVADDVAYHFALTYRKQLFADTPVVFCGVNGFEPADLAGQVNMTGVVEKVDFQQTIEMALRLHPRTERIVIVNDWSDTGIANRRQLEAILPDFGERVHFEFIGDVNMAEVQEKVAHLSSDSLVLLVTFNQDKSHSVFSYEESAELIARASSAPVYGCWDFYLGHGIVGGMVTSGYTQGETAAKLALRALNGERLEGVPVIRESPNRYMFDHRQLQRWQIDAARLPAGSVIVNKPESFYEKNQSIVFGASVLFAFLLYIIGTLQINIRRRRKAEETLRVFATIDELTGLFNRRSGMQFLQKHMEEAKRCRKELTVCFVDVNDLKRINDTFGHDEGDRLIKTVADLLQKSLRDSDVICRLGGDEFLLILPDCDLARAQKIWERVEESRRSINRIGLMPYAINFSHGFACYDPLEGLSPDELIKRADMEMYETKRALKAERALLP
ncbi:diguanylate cyclase [Heliobacterium gestii]|uniref:Diguanylate cyclase n=1 Tax=Heliomicrobium gestii TaxID=2699 RepID=A0A845L9A5_HELGE|nr:ABC transporter substrate binding protein [Heliomicrobium gestii]MBM7866497.1 diguanylate cyclase (GGDEF)-like protein [Heliomicrobium gestii]MZP43222.1 diguanylate cyclase [Heliomicrobium gestii]